MTTLAEFRSRYPQYDDMSDEELARRLHARHYSDIPYDVFAQRVDVDTQDAPQGGAQVIDPATQEYLRSRGENVGDALERSRRPDTRDTRRARATDTGRAALDADEDEPGWLERTGRAAMDWITSNNDRETDSEVMFSGIPEREDVRWRGGLLSGALNALPQRARVWLDAEGRSAQIGLGTFLDPSPRSREHIIEQSTPEADWRDDAEGHRMVRFPLPDGRRLEGNRLVDDEAARHGHTPWVYVNRPGASGDDALTFAGEFTKYTPAARFGAMGRTLAGRAVNAAAAGALTNAVSDAAAMPLGGEGPQGGEVALSAAFMGGGQVLSDLFVAGIQATPQLMRQIPLLRGVMGEPRPAPAAAAADASEGALSRASERFSRDQERGALSATERADGQNAAYEQADQFGIPLTRGQASGDATQIALEQRMAHGGSTDAAGNIMRPFVDRQAGALRDSGVRLATRGHDPISGNVEEAGRIVRDTLVDRRRNMRDLSDAAFDRATKQGALEPIAGMVDDARPNSGGQWGADSIVRAGDDVIPEGPAAFETADGTFYSVSRSGSQTTATAGADQMQSSALTVYLTPQQMTQLRSSFKPGNRLQVTDDGRISVVTSAGGGRGVTRAGPINRQTGENAALSQQFATQPQAGLHPVELFGQVDGGGFTGVKWGEAIRRVGREPPVTMPGGPSPPARAPESPMVTVQRALDDEIINLPEPHLASTRQAVESVSRLAARINRGEATLADVMRTRQAINALSRRAQSSDKYAIGVVRRALDDWTQRTFGNSPGALSINTANAIYRESRQTFGQRTPHDLGGGVLDDILENDRTGTAIVDAILGTSRPPKSALQAVRRIREIATHTTQSGRMAKRPTMTTANARFRDGKDLPSDELQAIREAAMYRIMAPIYARQPGATLPAEGLVSNLRRALDGPGSAIMREMFRPDELAMMRQYLTTVERLVPPAGTVNRSGTAYELARMMASMSDSLFSFLHIPTILFKAPMQALTLNVKGVVDAVRAQRATERPLIHLSPSRRASRTARALEAQGALSQDDDR